QFDRRIEESGVHRHAETAHESAADAELGRAGRIDEDDLHGVCALSIGWTARKGTRKVYSLRRVDENALESSVWLATRGVRRRCGVVLVPAFAPHSTLDSEQGGRNPPLPVRFKDIWSLCSSCSSRCIQPGMIPPPTSASPSRSRPRAMSERTATRMR